ncbi:MAG: TolC family protein [Candidatus Riflebacteria bacterium]|nr:TolC family protein [Candidatus Riflebacteria bacterium]
MKRLLPSLVHAAALAAALLATPAAGLDLAGLAALAKARNLSLQVARLDIEESWIDQRIAENSFIPNADLDFTNGQKRSLDDGQQAVYGAVSKTSLFSLKIKQEFKALGKYNEWQRDVARLKTQAKERLQERAELEVMRRLLTIFFQMAKQEELARIHEFNLGLIGQLLEIGRLNMRVGLALEKDVLRIEVQQANTQAALVRARHDFDNHRLDLANLLNLRDTASPTVDLPPSLRFPLAAPDASATRALLLERDLDLALARNDRTILVKTVTAARAAGKPTLNLNAAYNHGLESGPLKNTRDYSVSVSLSAPVYDSRDRLNEVRRAEKLLARAELTLQELEGARLLALEKAFSDYDEARQRIAFAEKALEQSRENMRVVGIRFKAGDAPITDLVDAQITFSGAAETAVNARYDERIRLATILLLTRQFPEALALDRGAGPATTQAIDLSGEAPELSPDIPAMDGEPEGARESDATPAAVPGAPAGEGTAPARPAGEPDEAATPGPVLPPLPGLEPANPVPTRYLTPADVQPGPALTPLASPHEPPGPPAAGKVISGTDQGDPGTARPEGAENPVLPRPPASSTTGERPGAALPAAPQTGSFPSAQPAPATAGAPLPREVPTSAPPFPHPATGSAVPPAGTTRTPVSPLLPEVTP